MGGLADICKDADITFRAVAKPANATWPTNKPVWGGDATGTGAEKAVTFSAVGARTVTVECGNTVTAAIGVVDNPAFNAANASISRVYTFRIPLNSNTWGLVDTEAIVVQITACHDGNNWHAILTGLRGEYSMRARRLSGVTEVTGPTGNTTAANSCPQASDLNQLSLHHGTWFMLGAIEGVHVAHLKSALENIAAATEARFEALQVADFGQTKAQAISAIMTLPAWRTAITDSLD